MRIMYIHHSGLIGGAGVSLLHTIQTLERAGHEVILYLPPDPSDMYRMSKERGIQSILCERRIGAVTYVSGIDSVLSPRFWYRLGLAALQWRTWNRRIEEWNPELVIVNSKTLCWMSRLRSVRAGKSICFVRETMRGARGNVVNRMISNCLERFSKVIFLSDYDRKRENLQRADTAVIHNYIFDTGEASQVQLAEKKKTWNLTPGRFCILYVGGISEMKGFHIAAEAVLSMGSDVELIVAGSDFADVERVGNRKAMQYAKQMQAWIAERDRFHQIHVIGKQQDMSFCYTACDVLLFPMQAPHQARPVFEAGYYGKPVVISDFENIREFVTDGYNGFTAQADEPKDFVQKLMRLKEDACLREMMGENNRINTRDKHSEAVIQNQIREVIQELEV